MEVKEDDSGKLLGLLLRRGRRRLEVTVKDDSVSWYQGCCEGEEEEDGM